MYFKKDSESSQELHLLQTRSMYTIEPGTCPMSTVPCPTSSKTWAYLLKRNVELRRKKAVYLHLLYALSVGVHTESSGSRVQGDKRCHSEWSAEVSSVLGCS